MSAWKAHNASGFLETLLKIHTKRSLYHTQDMPIQGTSNRMPCHRHTIPPQATFCFQGQKSTDQILEAIEASLSHGRLDEARELVYNIDWRQQSSGGHEAFERLVAQIDAMAIRYLIQPTLLRMQEFSCRVLPTTENLVMRIRQRNDKEAEMLLKMGARLPLCDASLETLRSLFESSAMPRTINFLMDNELLPTEHLTWAHFQACFNTPNVRVMLMLSKLPSIQQQLEAQDEATTRYIQAMYFYWIVRFYTQLDRDAESIRKLKAVVDTSCLAKSEILLMLQTFGDCWQELGADLVVRNWVYVETRNPFDVFRSLAPLIDQYGDHKQDYMAFVYEACGVLREVCQTTDRFSKMIGWLTLPLANDRLAPLYGQTVATASTDPLLSFLAPHLLNLSAA